MEDEKEIVPADPKLRYRVQWWSGFFLVLSLAVATLEQVVP